MVKIMIRGPGVLRISTYSQTLNVWKRLHCVSGNGAAEFFSVKRAVSGKQNWRCGVNR